MIDNTTSANTTNEGQPDEITSLAFISLNELENGVFRGGVLVTDSKGKPAEFRCTSTITPNKVQKVLYGNTLRPHMAVELAGQPLLSALKQKPQVVLVNQEELLELRPLTEVPVLFVTKQGVTMTVSEENARPSRHELLPSPSGKFDPVVVTSHWQYEGDIGMVRTPLSRLFSVMDVTEPFSRIANALKLVHDQDKGSLPNT